MAEEKRAMSRLTRKYQATIPKAVRDELGLQQGDLVLFRLDAGRVVVEKASPPDPEYLASLAPTLGEWLSPEDDAAYGDL